MKVIFKYLKVSIFLLSIFILVYILKNSFNSKDFSYLIINSDKKFLILCILVSIFEVFLKSIRLKELSKPFDINYKLIEFIKIQTISISFSLVTPGRVGEFTKIYLLNDKYKDKLAVSTFICLFERFFDILILCFFSLILCLLTISNKFITYSILISFVLMLLSLLFLFNIDKYTSLIKKNLPKKFYDIIDIFILNKKNLISKTPITLLITSIVWVINSLVQLLILKSIGLNGNLLLIVGINSIVAIMSILTILPLGLGTMDVSALFLYKSILKLKSESILFLLNASRVFSIIALLILFIPFIISDPKLLSLIRKKKSNL